MSNDTQRPKTLIFGIDGGTWDVMMPLIQAGRLPNLAHLLEEGAHGILRSTLPPLTAPAWISFMTGLNPGRHGIFDFKQVDITTYHTSANEGDVVDLSSIRGHTLWDVLGQHGIRTCVVGFPMTYPAWPINGYMLSGFPAPHVSTYPPSWNPPTGNACIIPVMRELSQEAKRDMCLHLVHAQKEALLDAVHRAPFDVYAIVFSSTDVVQHYFWQEMQDSQSPLHSAIADVYEAVDRALGDILSALSDITYTFIISDHGFGPAPTRYVNLNAFLEKEGFLRRITHEQLQKQPELRRKRIRIDFSRSLAYTYLLKPPVVGIVINVRGRQPQGIVSPGEEYETVRDRLIQRLSELKEGRTPVVKQVLRREEAYTGSYTELMPDILVTLHPDYKPTLKLSNKLFEENPTPYPHHYSGLHREEGIILLWGRNIPRGIEIPPQNIVDVYPTLLHIYGITPTPPVDGRILSLFTSGKQETALDEGQNVVSPTPHDEAYTPDEEQAILDLLRGLGYLDD